MVTSHAQQEATRTERDHVSGFLGFNGPVAAVLDPNNISDTTHLLNTKRGEYSELTNAHRGNYTGANLEQMDTFGEWVRAYRNANEFGCKSSLPFPSIPSVGMEEKEYDQRMNQALGSLLSGKP